MVWGNFCGDTSVKRHCAPPWSEPRGALKYLSLVHNKRGFFSLAAAAVGSGIPRWLGEVWHLQDSGTPGEPGEGAGRGPTDPRRRSEGGCSASPIRLGKNRGWPQLGPSPGRSRTRSCWTALRSPRQRNSGTLHVTHGGCGAHVWQGEPPRRGVLAGSRGTAGVSPRSTREDPAARWCSLQGPSWECTGPARKHPGGPGALRSAGRREEGTAKRAVGRPKEYIKWLVGFIPALGYTLARSQCCGNLTESVVLLERSSWCSGGLNAERKLHSTKRQNCHWQNLQF